MNGNQPSITALVIHLGPVQPFIEAARRFSDLAAGSRILSDLSSAVAEGVAEAGGTLVFPAQPHQEGSPNKVLAVCPGGPDQARVAAEAARQKLSSRWESLVGSVRKDFPDALDLPVFDDQARLDDWCQFYAAWATREGYPAARDAAERLLDGRKRTRDFASRKDRPGAPEGRAKSWQDAGREDVLGSSRPDALKRLRRDLLLKGRERLDALTAVKRFHPDRERFASVNAVTVRVSLERYRAQAKEVHRKSLADFERGVNEATHRQMDPAWFYPDRLASEAPDADLDRPVLEGLARALAASRFRPTPYYALVVADGDRMGRAISQRPSMEAHLALSRQLADFAGRVRQQFGPEREDRGNVLYCGGDDVLAVFPLETAVDAAERLGRLFSEVVTDVSLSVGVAIAHMLEPFDRVREWAREAERDAKAWRSEYLKDGPRGALAIRLQTRSGGHLTCRGPLVSRGADGPLDSLGDAVQAARQCFRDEVLSSKAPYDLRRSLVGVPDAAALKVAARVLSRKRGDGEAANDDAFRRLVDWNPEGTGPGKAARGLVDLMLLGRFLHAHRADVKGD